MFHFFFFQSLPFSPCHILEYFELMYSFRRYINTSIGVRELRREKRRARILCQWCRQYSYSPTAADDDYRRTISALNSLQSNTQAKSGEDLQHPADKLSRMLSYFPKCDINLQDLEQLSVIHVSGTKGKGSTCAYCERILRQYGLKTGFFSSPHLCSVRERIRINGESLSKTKFTEYFRKVYDQLKQETKLDSDLPPFFAFLTLMAFRVFLEERVDVGVIEVGIGGEYDSTNVLQNTPVVGITSLGFDHVRMLGSSITEIAWQKAGIIKPSSVVVTASGQPKAAMEILKSRAAERGRTLYVAPDFNEYESSEDIALGVRGSVQTLNASLALQLVNAWMKSDSYPQGRPGEVRTASAFKLSNEMREGLKHCSWPGRTQIVPYSTKLFYYLDGAHTDESIRFCLQWFKESISSSTSAKKVLVFNTTGHRDAKSLLKIFPSHCFDLICFCTNRIESSLSDQTDSSGDDWSPHVEEEEERAELNRRHWLEVHQNTDEQKTMLFSNVKNVHEFMQKLAQSEDVQVLVTGSLHLVGAFLTKLKCNADRI